MNRRYWRAATVGLAVFLLAALWRWSPLAALLDPAALAAWGASLHGQWYSIPAAVGIFVAAGLVMAPQSVLIVANALIFGPMVGFLVTVTGSAISSVVNYGLGAAAIGYRWRDWEGTRLHDISVALGERGILSMMVIRLIPLAHFSVVSLAAGASHIRLRDFFIGSTIGMIPWILATTVLASQFARAMTDPTGGNIALLVGISVAFTGALIWVARRVGQSAETNS